MVSEIQAGVCEILSVGQIGEERDESETRDRFTVKGAGNMTRTLYVRLMLEGIGQLMDHIMVVRQDAAELILKTKVLRCS